MTVPEPSVCATCDGERVVAEDCLKPECRSCPTATLPCPDCCCEVCGKPTDTPPECRDCAVAEETAAKRRADV